MSGLDIQDLVVGYDDTTIIAGLDLGVEPGETVAVIGPSGSGKSTLLRAIAGLEPTRSGAIHLNGVDLAGVPTHERDLGLMFQDHALFPHLSVADNIAFGPRMRQWDRQRRAARVDELLELVGLGGYGARRVDELSGGEAQRVALARSLAPSPGLLMLDEPLGSLDRVLREQLTVELGQIMSELSVTALHVTHDQGEAFTLADRIVVLRAGEIEQVGTPAELWANPANRFVANFVGHVNIWADPNTGREIVVPVDSVSVLDGEPADQTAATLVTVESRAFDAGQHRIVARRSDGSAVTFRHSEALSPGESIWIRFDRSRQIEL